LPAPILSRSLVTASFERLPRLCGLLVWPVTGFFPPENLGTMTKYVHVSYNQEAVMAISTSKARRDLVRLIERVNVDRTEVEITSKRGSAVLMSKDEYDALVETSYLLSSPRNAHRLLSALESVREVETAQHKLLEP
jgi:antitoxin YefM